MLFPRPYAFIYSIRRRETYSPSTTKFNRTDFLDLEGFLIYLYLGFTQSSLRRPKIIKHRSSLRKFNEVTKLNLLCLLGKVHIQLK